MTVSLKVYAASVRAYHLAHAGCWAHVRRKFDEAIKAMGGRARVPDGNAMQALNYIRKLYRVERKAKDADMSVEERHALRQEESRPIIDEIRIWLNRSLAQVPPRTALGKALGYMRNQWGKPICFLEDGEIPLDNNPAENAVRPFVMGRKARLFADTVHGAEASANIYSLVETAKANSLEPYRYLRYLFTHLPAADSVEAFEALLPTRVDPEKINALLF